METKDKSYADHPITTDAVLPLQLMLEHNQLNKAPEIEFTNIIRNLNERENEENELSNARNFGKLNKLRESVENDARKNVEAKMKEEIKNNIVEKNNGETLDENELEIW
ncbi:hypothetical protein BCR32DRAFT_288287 [Anaeromyces robustus]|uniref:Uncharacterized protein n=1 Tax=Anaeromyces robustus TaxID=1754192 RepID=A0A1Y1V265_9FUNG|nr:hypothetical protein BCR32DRAFT_288287 [Anaeromyces robustus]|eukprot:ORX44969.1 hypothetical protein BCR32DRAFT_288287 [Anaeromyces robustus]